MTAPFALHRPSSVGEALALFREHGDDAQLHAGGTRLVPLLHRGRLRPGHVVDVKRLPLGGIDLADGGATLRLGALATHRAVELSPLVAQRLPVLVELERELGNVRIRNQGTVGGNVLHRTGDVGILATALGGTYVTEGAGGERREHAAEGFVLAPGGAAIGEAGVLAEVRLPLPPAGAGTAHLKLRFRRRESATVSVLVRVADGAVADARVAVGIVEPLPRRIGAAEAALVGAPADPGALHEAGRAAAAEVEPVSDELGDAAYKRHVVGVLTRRALALALERAA